MDAAGGRGVAAPGRGPARGGRGQPRGAGAAGASAAGRGSSKPKPGSVAGAKPGAGRGASGTTGVVGAVARGGVRKARGGGRGGRVPLTAFGLAAAEDPAVEHDPNNAYRGWFTRDLRNMMYGFGDAECPLQETVELVEDVLVEYVSEMTVKAAEHAVSSLKVELDRHSKYKLKVDEKDILFLVRKDQKKFARIKQLLLMQQVIKDARKGFEDDVGGLEEPAEGGGGAGDGADADL